MKSNTFFDRMEPKSLNGLMITHFQHHYKLSPQAAQTICNDVVLFRNVFGQSARAEGQILHYAVKLGEPASKRIRDCQLIPVKLTLIDPKDTAYLKEHGLQGLTKYILWRISKEAYEQGAVLSTEDAAYMLHISERTVRRHKQLLKKDGKSITLRGDVADMGPGSCHRVPIIELYLQGYSETEVAQRTNHTLERVEEYLYDFLRISLLLKDEYSPGIASRLTGLSKSKVLAIKQVYDRLTTDSFYDEPLQRVLEIFELKRHLKKGVATR